MFNIKIKDNKIVKNYKKYLFFLVTGLVVSLCVASVSLAFKIYGYYPNIMFILYNIFLVLFTFFILSINIYLVVLIILSIRKKFTFTIII